MNTPHNTIGIIGFGRFGQLLHQILKQQFKLLAYDPFLKHPTHDTDILTDLDSVLECHTLFIAVPIHQFAETIHTIAPKLKTNTTIIDVCSVKSYPVKVMLNTLADNIGIIATHPMFGPDSFNQDHQTDCKLMMHCVRDPAQQYLFWKQFFKQQRINILEMTPEQHDKLAAKSQSITHFIGRALEDAKFDNTCIDTKGFETLLKLKQHTCNDSWELFYDLQHYNPYSKHYIEQFLNSANRIQQSISEKKHVEHQ